MKAIFRVKGIMNSDIQEIPDSNYEYNVAQYPGLSSMLSPDGDLYFDNVRRLTFRNTGEIAMYTAHREPVFIFELI